MLYLNDWNTHVSTHYGSKAGNLARLRFEGLRVPMGFAIKPDERLDLLGDDSLGHILRYLDDCGLSTGHDGLYAVRSSGLAEDGADSSYAGQHDTFLNVEKEGIIAKVIECRESGAKAEAYRDAKGEVDKGIAVLVQQMVPSYISGVTFTSDPFNMDLGTSVIEYTMGLGDKLVAGEINPTESYEVDNATGYFTPGLPNDFEDLSKTSMTSMMVDVHKTCQRIATIFDTPMDIEWAIGKDGRLWILQARPLTTGDKAWNYPVMTGRAVVKGRAEGIARWAEGDAENMMFDEGNILLAVMTNPHMVPLMMKASGIATKIGGRTCHAAIVSRELNKPCVVSVERLGVLQSGTKVVVDAFKGTVEA